MEEENVNKAVLPKGLPNDLLKLHLVLVTLGFVLIALGTGCVIFYDSYSVFMVVLAGMASLFAGFCGLFATRQHSVLLHSGALGTLAVTLWVGFVAFGICAAILGTRTTGYNEDGLLVCAVIFLLCDLLTAACLIGIQAAVLWVSSNQRMILRRPQQY